MRSVKQRVKKKVKIFGKSIPVLAIVAIAMSAGLVSAALVSYLSNVETTTVNVESPIELSGTITYEAVIGYEETSEEIHVEAIGESFQNVKADITRTDDLGEGIVKFEVEILDMNEQHGVYGTNIAISRNGSTIDFQVFYAESDAELGVWYGGATGAPGWFYQKHPWETNEPVPLEGTGIEVTGEGAPREGDRLFTVSIPIGLLGEKGATYYYAMMFRTNCQGTYPEGIYAYPEWMGWSTDVSKFAMATVGVPHFEIMTENFDGTLSVPLRGGDEFFMTFEATNLANSEMAVTLGLVMSSDAGKWKPIDELNEIASVDPNPSVNGVSSDEIYRVEAFDLSTIGAGQTVEYAVTIKLNPIAAPGTYTIGAVAVWTDAATSVEYIVEAARITE